jgi:hypothetical protein
MPSQATGKTDSGADLKCYSVQQQWWPDHIKQFNIDLAAE